MAQLGLTVDSVIRVKCKPYLDTLPEDKANAYIQRMKDAAGETIQFKIDEAEAILTSIQDTTQTCINNASSWATQIAAIAVPDVQAPKAGAASLLSLQNAVKMAKANLSVSSAQAETIQIILLGLGTGIPQVVIDAITAIDTANTALNSIPL